MELTRETIRKAYNVRDDLEYMIERFSTEGLEYLDLRVLKEAKKNVESDIKDYQNKLISYCPPLKVGAIIRIDGGDGICTTQRDYYNITGVTDTKVIYDKVTVEKGDYGIKVIMDKGCREKKEDWILKYNRGYHKDNIPLSEWYSLTEYTEKIPWPED